MGLPARAWILAAACALAAPGPARAAAPAGGGAKVRWATSVTTALAEAKTKGVPVLVAINMDDERGNDHMVEKVYTDAAFVAAAARCVCTIGSLGSHDQVTDATTGRKVCARFGSLSCADHQGVERVVRSEWLKRKPHEDVTSPQHFFLAPDGRRLFSRTWQVEAKELVALLARAKELSTPESLASWDTLEGRLARAGDPFRPVREGALRDLAAAKDAAVDGKLAALAKGSPDGEIACDVLAAFALSMTPERTALASSLLGAKSPEVRMSAAVALEASKDPSAGPALAGALAKEKDDGARGVLYRALSGCSPADPATRAAVLAGLKEKDAVLPHVLVALAPWAKDEEVVAALQPVAFGKDPWTVRAAACWTLGMSGRFELAPKLRQVKDSGRWSRLASVAQMAARRLDGDFEEFEYRRALRSFARSPVRHPGDPED
jgi:hypothetical protein